MDMVSCASPLRPAVYTLPLAMEVYPAELLVDDMQFIETGKAH
jgi:hypothetical protein